MEPHRERALRAHDCAGLYPASLGPLTPLSARFYQRPVLTVARALLGQLLVRRVVHDGQPLLLVGRIVETEAYGGRIDPASHSFRGLTPRCRTMFGPVGHLYVYFTYGSHFCANVIAGSRRDAAAVLLRALEPQAAMAAVAVLRANRRARCRSGPTADALIRGALDARLLTGPGNLTAALAIDGNHDGSELTLGSGEIWIAAAPPARRVSWTPRIGLGDNAAAEWLWRCVDADSLAVTAVPSRWPRAPRPTPTITEARRG